MRVMFDDLAMIREYQQCKLEHKEYCLSLVSTYVRVKHLPAAFLDDMRLFANTCSRVVNVVVWFLALGVFHTNALPFFFYWLKSVC
jgi:hypothetical protein